MPSKWFVLFENESRGPFGVELLNTVFLEGTYNGDVLLKKEGEDKWLPARRLYPFYQYIGGGKENGEWLLGVGENKLGPFSENYVGKLIFQKKIKRDTLAWHPGMDSWLPICDIEAFQRIYKEDSNIELKKSPVQKSLIFEDVKEKGEAHMSAFEPEKNKIEILHSRILEHYRAFFSDSSSRENLQVIDFAWKGYYNEPLSPIFSALFLVSFIFCWVFVSARMYGAFSFSLFMLLLFLVGIVMNYRSVSNINLSKLNKQKKGDAFLRLIYSDLLEMSYLVARGNVLSRFQDLEILDKDFTNVPFMNELNEQQRRGRNLFVLPSFHGTQCFGFLSFFLTKQALFILPKHVSNIRNQASSIGSVLVNVAKEFLEQSERVYPLVDLYRSTLLLVNQGKIQIILKNFEDTSASELFFNEMVMIDYNSLDKEKGTMTITTRDGRCFDIFSSAQITEKLKVSLRMYKSQDFITQSPKSLYNSNTTDSKECPMCAETVKKAAKICRYCRYEFVE